MTATVTTSADGRKVKVQVPAGQTSPAVMVSPDCVIAAFPGNGGSMYVEASWSSEADVNAGTANWAAWDQGTSGTVTAAAEQALYHATAVRFTATTATGVGEVSR